MRGKGSKILRKLSKGKKKGGDWHVDLKLGSDDSVQLGDKENECGNNALDLSPSKDLLPLKHERGVEKEEDGMIKARYDAVGEETREMSLEGGHEFEGIGLSRDVADQLVYAAIDERGMKMLQMEERLKEMSMQIAKIRKEKGDVTSEESGNNAGDLKESVERLDGLVQQVLQLNMLSKSDDMKRFEALSDSIAGIMNEHAVLRNSCHVLYQQVGGLLDRVCVLERNASVLSEVTASEQGEEQNDDVWSIPAVKADLKKLLQDVQYQKQLQKSDDVQGQSNHIMGVFGVFRAIVGAFVHHRAVRHVLVPLLAAVCVQRVSSRPSSSRVNKAESGFLALARS